MQCHAWQLASGLVFVHSDVYMYTDHGGASSHEKPVWEVYQIAASAASRDFSETNLRNWELVPVN